MNNSNHIVLIGGHGKVGLLLPAILEPAGWSVDSIIRNPADVDAMAAAFAGASAIVFSAGAGGGNPQRTRAVDYEAATRAMAAAEQAGVSRFVMVSYATAATDVHRLDPADPFYPYAKAKHDADARLRESGLDYTILGPGLLTLEPATRTIQVVEGEDTELPADRRVTSRANVAEVIAHVVRTGAASRRTVNFYDGQTPIAEAIS